MSFLTTAGRVLLTRTARPFLFTHDDGAPAKPAGSPGLGLYVHIPFCRSLCGFCPYCKVVYDEALAARYVDALLCEIERAGAGRTERLPVTSLYFGGGSPALVAARLGELVSALRRQYEIRDGVGVELHPEDVNERTFSLLRDAGVTRVSIGVQSFEAAQTEALGRARPDPARLAAALAAAPFETQSVDLIFALPGQTFESLRRDVDTAFASGANHVALYPFIDFTCTESALPKPAERQKRALLDRITDYLESLGCVRDSIWTFARPGTPPYSSMTRDNFLGFGCSATTLTPDRFTINTFSVEAYLERVAQGRRPAALTLRFTERQRMVYYLFWRAYTTRVSAADFEAFFGVPLARAFGAELGLACGAGLARRTPEGDYTLTRRGVYYFHYYEQFYTLSYIDKMWGELRAEAFPKELWL